ncbi:hypothetical protein [uncultured Mucilaginibacter sp.]|uniref:hypothetical protein n=1 Tax=uncultured Mucilaginibacter sp. TaxID=797541 RepID=UPI00263301C3|nr:hypothetical protein [uncultured Mucilaginibacter sp.]
MLNKEQLIQTIKELPESFSFDDLLDSLLLIQKIKTGLEQSAAGETLTTEEAKQKLNKWLK